VKQIEDAKTLVEEVKANLAKAEKELEAAREKVVQIHSDADLTIALKTAELQESMRDRQKRVQDASLSVITFENNKVLTAMRQRLFRIAMTQVKESLSKRITAELHTQIIDHQLGVLKSIAK
jgi:F0F1-type ATP synthase membrane subunit b/b'